jgi:hypothetical protein
MDVELPATENEKAATVKLWARRVWTLELSLVNSMHVGPLHRTQPSFNRSRLECVASAVTLG